MLRHGTHVLVASSGDILIQLSDDWEPVAEWDEKILKEFEGGW